MGWEKKNIINRLKRRFLHVSKTDRFFLETPHRLISPLPRPNNPQHLPMFWPIGAWGPGETGKPRWRTVKMAPYGGAHVHFQMKARILPELSLVFQYSGLLLSGSLIVMKGRYFILNKKAQDCLQTLALVTKHWSCAARRVFITVQVR